MYCVVHKVLNALENFDSLWNAKLDRLSMFVILHLRFWNWLAGVAGGAFRVSDTGQTRGQFNHADGIPTPGDSLWNEEKDASRSGLSLCLIYRSREEWETCSPFCWGYFGNVPLIIPRMSRARRMGQECRNRYNAIGLELLRNSHM